MAKRLRVDDELLRAAKRCCRDAAEHVLQQQQGAVKREGDWASERECKRSRVASDRDCMARMFVLGTEYMRDKVLPAMLDAQAQGFRELLAEQRAMLLRMFDAHLRNAEASGSARGEVPAWGV
jgi:predicted metal-dependent HD superfamily phosphohydrolase